MKLNLVENAIDFLEEAVQRLSGPSPTPKDFKYSILHLSSAVELLLKRRLKDEHWSLIFSNVHKASQEALATGDFASVDFNACLERLDRICGIRFPKTKALLRALRKLRNKVEHYEVSVGHVEAEAMLVAGWSFVLDFISEHIDLSQSEAAQVTFERVRAAMVEHNAFVTHRMDEIEPELEQARGNDTLVLDCPACLATAVPLIGGDPECLFCKKGFAADDFAQQWVALQEGYSRRPSRGRFFFFDEPPLKECPECQCQGLYEFPNTDMEPPSPAWICLICGASWECRELGYCARCGKPKYYDRENPVCADCWAALDKE